MLCDYSILVTLYKIVVNFCFLGFPVKAENENFTAAGSNCSQHLKYENSKSSFGGRRQKIARKSVSHVQHDLFFLIQPIISLICGVVVAVPVVVCQRGEIRDTKTLNLSRTIVSLQVLGRCFAFFTLRDQPVAQQ